MTFANPETNKKYLGNELFTIITPTHNRQDLIEQALSSIADQTYRPIEIIIVDDGSTDNTKTTVENWKNHLEHGSDVHSGISLKYIYQKNAGASAARNTGISHATGLYIQFLDSDDLLHPDRLQSLVAAFAKENADLLFTGFEGFDADTFEVNERRYANEKERLVELAVRGRLWGNTLRCAFTKELVDHIGPWDQSLTCFEDREYSERAVLMAKHPAALAEISASARRGGGPRQSDRLRTYEGRRCRIVCERLLAERALKRTDISLAALSEFASRLYGLGVRSYAMGWIDHGRACGEIATTLADDLPKKGRQRRLAWRFGMIGGWGYFLLSRITAAITLKGRS